MESRTQVHRCGGRDAVHHQVGCQDREGHRPQVVGFVALAYLAPVVRGQEQRVLPGAEGRRAEAAGRVCDAPAASIGDAVAKEVAGVGDLVDEIGGGVGARGCRAGILDHVREREIGAQIHRRIARDAGHDQVGPGRRRDREVDGGEVVGLVALGRSGSRIVGGHPQRVLPDAETRSAEAAGRVTATHPPPAHW